MTDKRRHESAEPKLRVFLCHSSGDKAAVRGLHKRLKEDGFGPWLDEEDLIPGQEWQIEIPAAVRSADVVLVCLSRTSVTREGYVQKEIKFALDVADEKPDGRIFIIPVRLEDVEVPNRLKQWQWVDLFDARGYQKLILALNHRKNSILMTDLPHPELPSGAAVDEKSLAAVVRAPRWRLWIPLAIIAVLVLALYQRMHVDGGSAPPEQPGRAEPKIIVPKAFGGNVDSNLLLNLLNAADNDGLNSGQLRLSLQGYKAHVPTIPLEKSFDVSFSSAKDCYFALLHYNSEHTFETVIPREGSGPEADEKLKAGVPYRLSAHATPPAGDQEFLLICAPERLDLERLLKGTPQSYEQSLSAVTFSYKTQAN